jgi:hypothetical protein
MTRMILLWPLKVGVIALILWYFLRERLPPPGDAIVAAVAGVLLHLAYAALMTEIRRSGDSRLLERTGRGEPPVDGKRSALIGTLHADGPVLRAPFSEAECIGYSYEISHIEYTSGSGRSGSTGSSTKVTDFSGIALAPCTIRTAKGEFRMLAYPFLSGLPEQKYKDPAHRERAAQYIRTTPFEKTTPLIGEIARLDRAMLETTGSLRKDWRIAESDNLAESTFEEQLIRPASKVCAFGIYSADKRSLLPNMSSDDRALLLVAGDAAQVGRQLSSGIRTSRRLAFWVFVPTAAVLAFILAAPWSLLRVLPGGNVIIDKQAQRLKDALGQNDVQAIAGAVRYVDPNMAFEEAARTPLMLVTSVAAAQILLEHGASIDAHDSNGYSVLMNVAERGSPELIRSLASRGAKVNERLSESGTTPLSIARDSNTPAAVDALLKAGATDENKE